MISPLLIPKGRSAPLFTGIFVQDFFGARIPSVRKLMKREPAQGLIQELPVAIILESVTRETRQKLESVTRETRLRR